MITAISRVSAGTRRLQGLELGGIEQAGKVGAKVARELRDGEQIMKMFTADGWSSSEEALEASKPLCSIC